MGWQYRQPLRAAAGCVPAGVIAAAGPSEKGAVPSKITSHAITLIKKFELDAIPAYLLLQIFNSWQVTNSHWHLAILKINLSGKVFWIYSVENNLGGIFGSWWKLLAHETWQWEVFRSPNTSVNLFYILSICPYIIWFPRNPMSACTGIAH